MRILAIILIGLSICGLAHPGECSEAPFLESELIFPLETWHNHASCIVLKPLKATSWFVGFMGLANARRMT